MYPLSIPFSNCFAREVVDELGQRCKHVRVLEVENHIFREPGRCKTRKFKATTVGLIIVLVRPIVFTAPPILSKLAGPIFETKNRAIFSGELFLGEEFREKHYLSTTLFPLIGCGVDSYLPELEQL